MGLCRQDHGFSGGAASPQHSQAGEAAGTPTRCKQRPSGPVRQVTGSSPAASVGGKGEKGEGWPRSPPPARSGAEGTAPLQAGASGGQLQAGQERARKGLVPLLFSQNKGSSLALLEVACSGCAGLLSSDNPATWELPCSSPVEPALRDANSFRMSCPLQRSVFRSPGWGGDSGRGCHGGPGRPRAHRVSRTVCPVGDLPVQVMVDGESSRNAEVAGALVWPGCCRPMWGVEGDLRFCCISLCPMQLPREHRGQALLSGVGSVWGWGPESLGAHGDAFREGTLANC